MEEYAILLLISFRFPCGLSFPSLPLHPLTGPSDFYFAGQLDDYKVMSKLGQGQFGVVKLGLDVRTNQRVALKIIDKTKLGTADRSASALLTFLFLISSSP